MSGSVTPRNPYLSRGLYAYAIPSELLDCLTVRSLQALNGAPPTDDREETAKKSDSTQLPAGVSENTTPAATNIVTGSSLTCTTCSVSFRSIEEQRNHFKTDWHRYNAKASTKVSEAEFEEINDGLSSLSGSASSSDESEAGSDAADKVSRLLRRQKLRGNEPGSSTLDNEIEEEEAEYRRRAEMRTAMIWYRPRPNTDIVPSDTQFGIYRSILPNAALNSSAELLPALKSIQMKENDGAERKFTLLMVAGGHFAGMVVSLRPLTKGQKQDVKGAGDVKVLRHKTFHRYTTRRKQGGSQSLNDNAKSKANSAGAMLRRYGEQSLQEDIAALMEEWSEDIQSSERIFLRASTASKQAFWGDALQKGDERIKTFPFPTRRPTLSEILRCFNELTRVKITHISEEELAEMEKAYIASLQPKTRPQPVAPIAPPSPKPQVPKVSAEELAARETRRRLTEMIRKGRIDPLSTLIEKQSIDVNAPLEDSETLLMIASAAGSEESVAFLLDRKADPTIQTNSKTAYDMASTKGVRDLFRRYAYDHPDWHDWLGAAHVPSGLSEEKEAEQQKKRAERRKGLREKAKEREAKRPVEAEPEPEVDPAPSAAQSKPSTGPQKLGGKSNDLGVGLSPEMRAKIERERRARAAEARLLALAK